MPTKKQPKKKPALKRAAPKRKVKRSDFSRIMAGLEKGVQPIKKDKPSQYVAEIAFVSNRVLTHDEIDAVKSQLAVVVEEPSDEWATGVSADHMSFTTKDVRLSLKRSRQRRR